MAARLGMNATTQHHLRQRLFVGAVGLAVVVVLIVIAGALLGSVMRQRAATATGPRTDLAARLARGNEAVAEPLHDMGVAPGVDANAADRP